MSELLKLKKRPDAVFCYNDLTAVGAIRCLLANKLRVPEDVAVIGCGNLLLSSYLEVPLSSIDQSPQQQGEEAASMALSLLEGKSKAAAKYVLLKPKLIAGNRHLDAPQRNLSTTVSRRRGRRIIPLNRRPDRADSETM